ncbi:hypothetical protein T11_10967 [Trichinella zimbabwensis]|uniref:Uncharacterized protein n=1 Tax=Trichinella zimbabwensis TaxID=268475 RepID=A0A0V1GIV7_9BILA|nr:hypothetical protein T11_10967 [Trichinella zimbabwensis]
MPKMSCLVKCTHLDCVSRTFHVVSFPVFSPFLAKQASLYITKFRNFREQLCDPKLAKMDINRFGTKCQVQ